MWCSRQNGKMMFYIGLMLVIVGLGLVVMNLNLPGAILMCIGIFPLFIGFLVIVTHLIVENKMRKKQMEDARDGTVADKNEEQPDDKGQ